MKQYIYDSSWEGLLTGIYQSFSEPGITLLPASNSQPELFTQPQELTTDNLKSQKALSRLMNIGLSVLSCTMHIYLSEKPMEKELLAYIHKAFVHGELINKNYADKNVYSILETYRQVRLEVQRLKGLLRFKELSDSTLYAPLEPDSNITPILANHFKNRMPKQHFIIHDLKRGSACIYDGQSSETFKVMQLQSLHFSDREKTFQNLWKEFHKSIAIADRHNPRLQRQFMPVRYWKYLVEKS